MTDYNALATSLSNAKDSGGIPASIQQLPKFLSTSGGKQAVRAAIDSMIARQKMLGVTPPDAHQEIIKSLLGQMGGGSNATAPPSSPMQEMPMPNSQMDNMAQGAQGLQSMGQPQGMLGMSNPQGQY